MRREGRWTWWEETGSGEGRGRGGATNLTCLSKWAGRRHDRPLLWFWLPATSRPGMEGGGGRHGKAWACWHLPSSFSVCIYSCMSPPFYLCLLCMCPFCLLPVTHEYILSSFPLWGLMSQWQAVTTWHWRQAGDRCFGRTGMCMQYISLFLVAGVEDMNKLLIACHSYICSLCLLLLTSSIII